MEEDLKKIEYFLDLVDETIDENIEVEEIEIKELRQAIENLIKGYKALEKENKTLKGFTSSIFNDTLEKDYIPKSKVREVLDTKYIAMFEGDTEFPDDATIMKTVKYVKVSNIEELLEEGDK